MVELDPPFHCLQVSGNGKREERSLSSWVRGDQEHTPPRRKDTEGSGERAAVGGGGHPGHTGVSHHFPCLFVAHS